MTKAQPNLITFWSAICCYIQ